ncbi:MAG: 50S ribosomal protein L25 [Lentisphaerae bacterium]|nr:50S ribosomal protein L25 [Lentisphaerota bacterium]OQC13606.1 MAG: 50S ribosomal protein L25 [Lentisphaerae bacterium ADurb.Bin082]HQL87459.1 50S ribosomal protein L25 [Lentisphaeria bacterium]
MGKVLNISASDRGQVGSANSRRLRRVGQIPVVVYGHGKAASPMSIATSLLGQLLQHPGLVEMACDDGSKRLTILKAAQRHPISNDILHLDFQEVKMDELITSEVRLMAEGEAAGIRQGGQLEQVMFELEIECLPMDTPDMIRVDVSGIELDGALHVRDLVMPEGVTAVTDGGLVVFQVRTPKAELPEETEAETEAETEEEASAEKKEEK